MARRNPIRPLRWTSTSYNANGELISPDSLWAQEWAQSLTHAYWILPDPDDDFESLVLTVEPVEQPPEGDYMQFHRGIQTKAEAKALAEQHHRAGRRN